MFSKEGQIGGNPGAQAVQLGYVMIDEFVPDEERLEVLWFLQIRESDFSPHVSVVRLLDFGQLGFDK